MEELELICKKEKDVIDNCDQIIIYCESYKKKATDLRESLQRIKHTHDFRKAYYKVLHAITSLYSFTNEFMLELELSCPSEDEQDHELIEVPCLPTVDGESQNQQFEMVFLHGSSPWNFWLSHCDEKMTKKIKELLQKRENNLQELVEKPICGDYVLFKQGTHLQRAVVQKTLSSDRYQILDIDSGAIALIRQKRLYKMDEEISLIPCQAVNCFLIEDSEDSSLWTKELEEIFSSTLKRCKLTVKILDKKPGYPTSFFVNLEAEDIDDTELTVDVGKWVSRRIIPVLKSRSNLRVSALDAFFNEQFEEENDDECSDSSNYKTGDDSSQNQAPPVVESSNSVCSSDREDMVDTSNKESHVSGTNKIIPLEIIPLTKAAEDMFLRKEEVCAANEKKSSKIAAKFPANNNYPMYPPTSALMPMYPFIPISQNANSMREYPVFRLPPSGMMNTTNPMMGYPVIHSPPNAGPMMGYAINPRPPLTDSVRSYRVEPKPPNSALRISPTVPRPPSASSTNSKKTWSSHDFDSVIDKKYETPKFELKTPVVLVNPKDELRAMCSYVVSPYEFYVHLVNKNNAKIDLLEVDLEEFYSKCTNYNYSPDSRSKFCACKYIWNEAYSIPPLTTWFRAEIISFRGDQALVFLVDYGVTLNRNISDLRILDQRFYVYDKMAQRCHLHGMPVSRFSEDVCNYFKKIMQSMKDSLQLIIEANRNGFKSSLAVVIKHPQGDGYINDEIVEFIKSKEVNLFEQYDWDPMKEDFYADTNRLDHVVDNPLMATGGYIPKDEERLCKFFRETGRCPKKSCRQEHVYMGPDVFTVDRAETYANTFNKLKLPQEGSKLKVKVMTVISPTRFYGHWLYDNVVQKIPNKSGKHSGMYKYDLDDDDEEYYDDDDEEEEEETLVTLMNSLNAPRNTVNYKYLEGGLPSVGEMVIVKNIETDNLVVWYRARVSEVDEKYCVVFLIDFGVTLEVCTNFLRAMEPRFLHLPPQATEFCVAGVEAIDDRWSPDGQSTSILSQLENTCLYGYVLKRDLINHAVEVNLTNMNGDSIRSYLVDSGRYKLREMVVFGEDSSLLPG